MEELHTLHAKSNRLALEEGEMMDLFVSHTWSSNAYLKYLALLYAINRKAALISGHALALMTFLVAGGLRFGAGLTPPTVQVPQYFLPSMNEGKTYTSIGFVCFIVGSCTQLAMLLFGHRVRRQCGKEMAFFDKCCICQADEDLKRAGILAIGRVLEQTKKMVLLWDTQYFTRLWCTYEVAAFSSASSYKNVQLLPLMLALWVFCMFVIVTLGLFCLLILAACLQGLDTTCSVGVYFAVWFFLGPLLCWTQKCGLAQRLTVGRIELLKQLENFSVRDANVFDERDRAFVEAQIQDWFGSLEEFDKKVREELGEHVRKALGPSWCSVPLFEVMFENTPFFYIFVYDGILSAETIPEAIQFAVLGTAEHLVLNPLYVFMTNAFNMWLESLPWWKLRQLLRALWITVVGLWLPAWTLAIARVPPSHWVAFIVPLLILLLLLLFWRKLCWLQAQLRRKLGFLK